jgi:hypothetical protein
MYSLETNECPCLRRNSRSSPTIRSHLAVRDRGDDADDDVEDFLAVGLARLLDLVRITISAAVVPLAAEYDEEETSSSDKAVATVKFLPCRCRCRADRFVRIASSDADPDANGRVRT